MIKAFIFDLDGTLVDTEPLFSEAWQQIGDRYGRTYTNEIKKSVMANKAILAVENVLKAWGLAEDPHDILAQIEKIYLGLVDQEVKPLPGFHELMSTLDELKIRKAISTSSHRKWVDTIFDKLELHDHFEHITTGDDLHIGKPEPEAFLIPIHSLGLQPDECVAVEDSIHGVASAKSAGALAIAIPSQFMPQADFSNADFVLPSLADITKEFILSLGRQNAKR